MPVLQKKEKTLSMKLILTRIGVIVVFLVIFLIGVTVMFYPDLSDYINRKNASRVMASYQQAVDVLSEVDYSELFAEAQAYNLSLYEKGFAVNDTFGEERNEDGEDIYWNLLKVGKRDVMGYLTIDKIDVSLPIYHGASEEVLAAGVGHIHGSSLPIGGENTHGALSAHTGLPSARLFTNLDQLESGDTFYITVLNEKFTYVVDQILVVLPNEVEALAITPGEDYITLVTCTPYGINSHRLLVRGNRIENIPETDEASQLVEAAGESQENSLLNKLIGRVFIGFAAVFETIATLLVRAAEAVMRLFSIEY